MRIMLFGRTFSRAIVKTVRLDPYFVATILISGMYLAICASGVVGNFQNYNGDFGQYFIHSQNLIKGRPWGYLLQDYPAVLPGYSVLLALIFSLLGPNAYFVGMANVILWTALSLISYLYFRKRFKTKIAGVAYFIACLFASYVFIFVQDGQPNIFYSFSFVLAMCAAPGLAKDKWPVFLVLAMLLPATIRIESLVIFVALAILFVTTKQYRKLWLPALGAVLTLGLDLLIATSSGMTSNISHFASTSISGPVEQASAWESASEFLWLYVQNFIGLIVSFTSIIVPHSYDVGADFIISASNGFRAQFGFLGIVLFCFFCSGFLAFRRAYGGTGEPDSLFSYERLLLVGHVGFVALFLLKAVAFRYLLPAFPIFLFFTILGVERLAAVFRIPQWISAVVMALVAVHFAVVNVESDRHFARSKNFIFAPDTVEMADVLADIKGDRRVAFWKPRLLTVMLDLRGAATDKTLGARSPDQIDALFAQDGLLVVFKPWHTGAIMDHIKDEATDACKTWQNKSFEFFEMKSDGRICLDDAS